MRVTMMKTTMGSEDGTRVALFVEGQTYELGAELAQSFLGSKCARPADPIEQRDQTEKTDPKDQTDQRAKKKGKGPDENK